MADHHHYQRRHHTNPPPLPHFPNSPYLPYPPPLMASSSSTRPLNAYAVPFLSAAPPSFLPPPPPPPPHVDASLMSGYGNYYYPRAASPAFYWQLHTHPAVSYYNAWPQVVWPPRQAAAPTGSRRREFAVSGGPQKWVEKRISSDGGGDYSSVEKITTVMIKNIPNQLRRQDLLHLLDRYCRFTTQQQRGSRAEYDFVYLPMDFRRGWYEGKISNLGYAFVNFTTPMAASQFCASYHNHEWDVNVNKKICEITQARIQGKTALTNAFKNKIFWCANDQYLPVMLSPPSNGRRRYRRINVGRRIPRLPRRPIKRFSS